MKRLLAAVLCSGIVFGLGSLPSTAGISPKPCGVAGLDGWTTVANPDFPSIPDQVTAYAADPVVPTRLFVTNGKTVLVSSDFGCTWSTGFELPIAPSAALPVSFGTDSIESLVMPDGGGRLFMVINKLAGAGPPVIAAAPASSIAAPSAAQGLPPVGQARLLTFAGNAAYVAIRQAAADLIYRSSDGGTSWQMAGDPTAALLTQTPGGFVDLAADAAVPSSLWGTTSIGTFHSVDGGATFQAVPEAGGASGLIDVLGNRVSVFTPGAPSAMWSNNGGSTWAELALPAPVISVTHDGPTGDLVIAMTDPDGLSRAYVARHYGRFTPPWSIMTKTGAAFSDLSASRSPVGYVYGRGSDGLRVYDPLAFGKRGEIRRPPPVTGCEGSVGQAGEAPPAPEVEPPPPPSPAVLMPQHKRLTLNIGESRKVDYRLVVPPRPTPLDIYFLVDTTGSMSNAICGIRVGLEGIVREMASSGVDVQMGVGEFKGFEDGVPYRKLRGIGPIDQSLVDALYKMEASGGTTETQLTALYQSATGAGWDVGPDEAYEDVPPGGQAGFRSDSLRIIVLVTDEVFGPNEDDPTMRETIDALNANDITVVGAHPASGGGRLEMMQVAEETGAIAPRAGVDCDGDGVMDIYRGQPLVCDVLKDSGSINLAPTIVGLARAISDVQEVDLVAARGDEVVDRIAPGSYAVDVRDPQVLDHTVTYRCAEAQGGLTIDVKLRGRVATVPIADATAELRCRPPLTPPPPAPPLFGAALAPPVPPGRVPANSPQPRPETQTQSSQQAQGQVAPGMAAQKQQQPQMAMVHAAQRLKEQIGMEQAMSQVRVKPDPLLMARYGLAAGVLGLMGAFAVARVRLRSAPSVADTRGTRRR